MNIPVPSNRIEIEESATWHCAVRFLRRSCSSSSSSKFRVHQCMRESLSAASGILASSRRHRLPTSTFSPRPEEAVDLLRAEAEGSTTESASLRRRDEIRLESSGPLERETESPLPPKRPILKRSKSLSSKSKVTTLRHSSMAYLSLIIIALINQSHQPIIHVASLRRSPLTRLAHSHSAVLLLRRRWRRRW